MTIAMAGGGSGATVEGATSFFAGGNGMWAGQQFIKAMKFGQAPSPAHLRTLDVLRKDEWRSFDEALVTEGALRLTGVADLVAAGLTVNIPNGLGKTVHEYEKITDMTPAVHSLDGNVRSEGDRQEFQLASLPLPITHKDFHINLRTLMASRNRGEALDTTQVRTAGRLVSEATEDLLFNGAAQSWGGLSIFGYRTFPDRNVGGFSGANWDTAVGAVIVTDVQAMMSVLRADRFFGPYWLYLPANFEANFDNDFKAETQQTIRQRLMEFDSLTAIRVADQMPDDEAVLVQATSDVVQMVQGEALQTVQWDINGGFGINFKAFTINVPLLKSDHASRSGVFHIS